MDILYKHRWGVYEDGRRIRIYLDEEKAKYMANYFQRQNPLNTYVAKQVSWLHED